MSHEARHFIDYKLFPKLDQIDLEYREKLTEIILAKETFREIIDKFSHEQGDDRTNPHAFAAHQIMTRLSRKLGIDSGVFDLHSIDMESIKSSAKALLDEHSQLLTQKGVETTTTVF